MELDHDKKDSSRRTRSRRGCFTCRKRKKRCDETKPICHACKRLNLVCQYPGEGPHGGDHPLRQYSEAPSMEVSREALRAETRTPHLDRILHDHPSRHNRGAMASSHSIESRLYEDDVARHWSQHPKMTRAEIFDVQKNEYPSLDTADTGALPGFGAELHFPLHFSRVDHVARPRRASAPHHAHTSLYADGHSRDSHTSHSNGSPGSGYNHSGHRKDGVHKGIKKSSAQARAISLATDPIAVPRPTQSPLHAVPGLSPLNSSVSPQAGISPHPAIPLRPGLSPGHIASPPLQHSLPHSGSASSNHSSSHSPNSIVSPGVSLEHATRGFHSPPHVPVPVHIRSYSHGSQVFTPFPPEYPYGRRLSVASSNELSPPSDQLGAMNHLNSNSTVTGHTATGMDDLGAAPSTTMQDGAVSDFLTSLLDPADVPLMASLTPTMSTEALDGGHHLAALDELSDPFASALFPSVSPAPFFEEGLLEHIPLLPSDTGPTDPNAAVATESYVRESAEIPAGPTSSGSRSSGGSATGGSAGSGSAGSGGNSSGSEQALPTTERFTSAYPHLDEKAIRLYIYFRDKQSILMSVSPLNYFRSVFLAFALRYEAIMYGILAWAAWHKGDEEKLARRYFEKSSGMVRKETINSRSKEEILAALLILASAKICSGDTSTWRPYLAMAGETIHLHGGLTRFMESESVRWLLKNFAYHEILTSSSLSQPKLFTANDFELIFNTPSSAKLPDTLCACCQPVFVVLERINELTRTVRLMRAAGDARDRCTAPDTEKAAEMKTEKHESGKTAEAASDVSTATAAVTPAKPLEPSSGSDASSESGDSDTESTERSVEHIYISAHDLEQKIWTLQPAHRILQHLSDKDLALQQALFDVFKLVAVLHMYQSVLQINSSSISMRVVAQRLLKAIDGLFATTVEGILIFPLFVLGVSSSSKSDREYVVKKFEAMEKRLHARNVTQAKVLLLRVWERDHHGKHHIDWNELMDKDGLHFCFC